MTQENTWLDLKPWHLKTTTYHSHAVISIILTKCADIALIKLYPTFYYRFGTRQKFETHYLITARPQVRPKLWSVVCFKAYSLTIYNNLITLRDFAWWTIFHAHHRLGHNQEKSQLNCCWLRTRYQQSYSSLWLWHNLIDRIWFLLAFSHNYVLNLYHFWDTVTY